MTARRGPPFVNLVSVRGTALLPNDNLEQYRQKLARITLDSMVQFVGLLDAQGTIPVENADSSAQMQGVVPTELDLPFFKAAF